MFHSVEEAIDNIKKLVDFDVGDGDFGPHFGDLVQAMHRASTLGLDLLLQETEHDSDDELQFNEVKFDAFAKLVMKVFACIANQQERAAELWGEDEDEHSPTVSMLRPASDDTPVISEEAAEMFKQLMLKKQHGTDGANEG